MSQHNDIDRSLARWFDAEPGPAPTADVLDRALGATRRHRPRPRWFAGIGSHWVGDGAPASGVAALGLTGLRTAMALLLLLLALGLVAGAILVGSLLLRPAPVDLGIFAPIAGRIVYGDESDMWGIDPIAPADSATRVQLTAKGGIPLGWSSDGTRLLVMRGSDRQVDAEGRVITEPDEHLFVLRSDGSELEVTEGPWSIRGATISPDGSRVVFAGVTNDTGSALYAVDVDGGPAGRLVGPGDDLIQQPTFSPDGTRIAFTSGGGDHSNNVWLMKADGSDAHEILANETTEGAGHVRGLSWSPAGDQIALGLAGKIYTFAADGSGFTEVAGAVTSCDAADPCAVKLPKSAESPYWSPDGSQIAYTTGCIEGAGAADRDGCHLAIADADGSNVQEFSYGASGPWHPGTIKRPS
jgi:dipeptidyl aminopeptidase/acylaminoacyl peptidase